MAAEEKDLPSRRRTVPPSPPSPPSPAPPAVRPAATGMLVELDLRDGEIFEAMVWGMPTALYVIDGAGIVHMWNPAAEKVFGWSAAEVLGHRLPIVHPGHEAEFDRLRGLVMAGEGFIGVDAARRRKDGTRIDLSISTVPLRNRQGTIVAVFGVAQDQGRMRQVEDAFVHQATHDPLTDLLNRQAFLSAVQEKIDVLGTNHVLVYFDLDNFKDVNDTQGHQVGDALLRLFAERLGRSLRPGSLVGRLGGDEFGVLLGDVPPDRVAGVVGRLLTASCGTYVIEGRRVLLHASAGVAPSQGGGRAEETLRHADMAMYEAKRTARNSFRVFDREIQRAVVDRIEMAVALEAALDNDELEIHYQPIISVPSGRMVGMEALARWRRDGGSYVPPDQFIALAEQSGTIGRLGRWVLDRACAQLRRWSDAQLGPAADSLVMSVNLSPRQLHEAGLVAQVREVLATHGLNPGRLQLEVTETALMRDVPAATTVLERLRRLGVLLAIDDFGTGNSSLTLLRQMPFGGLKVDRSFVAGIGTSPEDTAIVSATLGLAQSLGLATTAEGVETVEQLAFLREHGCDQAQGYLLGRPAAALDRLPAVDVFLPALPTPERL